MLIAEVDGEDEEVTEISGQLIGPQTQSIQSGSHNYLLKPALSSCKYSPWSSLRKLEIILGSWVLLSLNLHVLTISKSISLTSQKSTKVSLSLLYCLYLGHFSVQVPHSHSLHCLRGNFNKNNLIRSPFCITFLNSSPIFEINYGLSYKYKIFHRHS